MSDGAEHAPVVQIAKISRRFGSLVAVREVSFTVARGEIFGLLGPNGAGKSTLLRMLCGILAPSGGEGRVVGFDIRTQAERIKEHIGYMAQRPPRSPQPARGNPLGRLEAAPGADLRDHPSPAAPLPRRADRWRRPGEPPPLLGADSLDLRPRHHGDGHHPLHG
jgi:hypothetical protein